MAMKQEFSKVAVAVNTVVAILPIWSSITAADAAPPPALSVAKKLPPAPWSKPPLSPNQVPKVFIEQWRQTKKRGSVCAALAPINLGKGQGAKPRVANFGTGAWANAYDKPGLPGRRPDGSFCANCGRGAFGIAGTSGDANEPSYPGFPFHRQWADGSRADYGLEGGKSLPYLAYLKINNQRCLYNVWSFLGRDHLEYLLQHLRFVKGAP